LCISYLFDENWFDLMTLDWSAYFGSDICWLKGDPIDCIIILSIVKSTAPAWIYLLSPLYKSVVWKRFILKPSSALF